MIRISKKDLASAVSLADAFTTSRSTLPAFQLVSIAATRDAPGLVRVGGAGYTGQVETLVAASTDEEDGFAVIGENFIAFLRAFDGDDVKMEKKKDRLACTFYGNGKSVATASFAIKDVDIADFPLVPAPVNPQLRISAVSLKTAIAKVSHLTPSDEATTFRGCIFLQEVSPKKASIIRTDGNACGVVPVEVERIDGWDADKKPVAIPLASIPKLERLLAFAETVEIAFVPERNDPRLTSSVQVRAGDALAVFQVGSVHMPDVAGMIAAYQKQPASILTLTADVALALSIIDILADGTVTVDVSPVESPAEPLALLRLLVKSANGSAFSDVVLPLAAPLQSAISAEFSIRHIREILAACGPQPEGAKISLVLDGKTRPLLATTTGGEIYLAAPIPPRPGMQT